MKRVTKKGGETYRRWGGGGPRMFLWEIDFYPVRVLGNQAPKKVLPNPHLAPEKFLSNPSASVFRTTDRVLLYLLHRTLPSQVSLFKLSLVCRGRKIAPQKVICHLDHTRRTVSDHTPRAISHRKRGQYRKCVYFLLVRLLTYGGEPQVKETKLNFQTRGEL